MGWPSRKVRSMVGRIWPEALVAAAAVAIFARALFTSASFYLRDIGPYILPLKQWWRGRVLSGELPEWIPSIGLGMPFLADPGNQCLYPPAILLLFPLPGGLDVFLTLHVVFAAIGAVRLARALGADPSGSAVAGATFGLGGYMVSMTGSGLYLCSAAYLPWVALAIGNLWRAPAIRRPAAILAALLALQLLAGDFQGILLSLAIGLALLPCYPAEAPATAAGRRRSLRFSGGLALALGSAALLAGCQLIPSLIFAGESVRRDGVPLEIAEIFSTHPLRLLGIFISRPWGDPVLGPYHGRVMEGGGKILPWAFSLYSGSATLVLVPLALGRAARRRSAALMIVLALVVLAFACGSHTPLYALAHRFVPLFAMFRYPEKLFAAVALILAQICGLGASASPDPARSSSGALIKIGAPAPALLLLLSIALWLGAAALVPAMSGMGLAAAEAKVALAGLAKGAAISSLLALATLAALFLRRPSLVVCCCVLDLLVAASGVHQAADFTGDHLAPELESRARAGAAGREPMRLYGLHQPFLGHPALAERLNRLTADPNRGIEEGIGQLEPYSAALPNSGATLLTIGKRFPLRLATIASATAIVTDAARIEAGDFPGLDPVGRWGPLALLDLPGHLPRARVQAAALGARSEASVVGRIEDPRFPLDRVAVILGPVPDWVPAYDGADLPDPPTACTITSFAPERVAMRCDAPGAGVAVLADQYGRGWSVTVDGRPGTLLQAQLAMRAVALPQGDHTVVFDYDTPGLGPGLICSLAGLIAIGLLLVGRPARKAVPAGSASRGS